MLTGKVQWAGSIDYVFLTTDDGEKIFCHRMDYPEDAAGRKYLLPGEQVTFVTEISPRNKAGKPSAANVQIISFREPIAEDYREVGEVVSISPYGDFCWLRRPRESFHQDNIHLHYKRAEIRPNPTFELGQFWEYSLHAPTRDKGGKRWQAFDAIVVEPVPAEEIGEDNWAAHA
jgi:cold shock CspA family protein